MKEREGKPEDEGVVLTYEVVVDIRWRSGVERSGGCITHYYFGSFYPSCY